MVKFRPQKPSFWIAFILLWQACGCEIINPEEEVPSLIQIDSITVSFTDPSHGSISSNIKDAWVFIDDELIGVFELPATVPVLAKGKHRLMIGPGILVSGQVGARDSYPFYTAYTDDAIVLVPGEKVQVNPVVEYRPSDGPFAYELIEDFENTFGLQIDTVKGSHATISRTHGPGEVFEGNASGKIQVKAGENNIVQTVKSYQLPSLGNIIYLEMDYKSTTNFIVGFVAEFDVTQDLYVTYIDLEPTSEWNKLYLNLTNAISNTAGAEGYAFYFQATDPETDGSIFIDNLKLMYQK